MADKKPNSQVFFITSNQSKINEKLDYSINQAGIINLKPIVEKTLMYKREDFTTRVFSFEIIPNDLKEKDKTVDKKKYLAKIALKFNKNTFIGEIPFFKERNNFRYGFSFQDYEGWIGTTSPPIYIKYTKAEQIQLFNEVLKKLNVKQGDPLSLNLISDSQLFITGQKFYLDFYIEILKLCYSKKEVKMHLMMFKLERVLLPEKMDTKLYSNFLGNIERKPDIIIRHCNEKEKAEGKPERYFKCFYTLLLYYRANYEQDKIKILLEKRDLWKYFVDILPINHQYFPNLQIPNELIIEMVKKEPNTFKAIKGALSFLDSTEKILSTINDNCKIIYDCCIKEKQIIEMSEMANPKKDDDLNKVIDEIKKVIQFQLEKGKQFISFGNDFWKTYIQFNDKKNIHNLILINHAIIIYKKTDKNLQTQQLNLVKKIHDTGLEAIEKGELKNEDLLDFIEREDIYFTDGKYESKIYRPLSILKGIDLDTVDEKFYEKWDKSSIFKIFSFDEYSFKKELVNKVVDMKDFGKLFKLFNYKRDKIFDNSVISLLREKFKNIIQTYKKEKCPNFIKDIALFIYVIDKKTNQTKNFMEKTIEQYIKSFQDINDIYLYLSTNYNDISRETIDSITNYFTKNKDRLKGQTFLFLLKLENKKIIQSILNKIDNFVIKEEEILSQEKDIDSFLLLEGIEKEKLLMKCPELSKTKYLMNTFELGNNFIKKCKEGEMSYSSVSSIRSNKEKKALLKERLSILFFNNQEDVENCLKIFDETFVKINKVLGYIKKLLSVLKEFFEIKHQKNIKMIEIFEKDIKAGKLNEIEKPANKSKLETMKQILPDLDDKFKLKNSKFFTYFFRNKKANSLKKEDEIFNETFKDFEKLKAFFEENWINKIDESIVKEIYKASKNMTDLKLQLKNIRDRFKLQNIDDLYLDRLEDEIKIFSKKEEIFQTVNSCLHFISEFGAKQGDFSKSLNKLRDDISKNISVDKIKEYGKTLLKYGINILDPKPEDKDYLNILHSLYSKKGSLKFIMVLTDDDCHILHELVSESENTFLTGAEIQDMTKCSNFIHSFGTIKDVKTDQELISLLIEKVPQVKTISAYFIQYTNNFGQIQELFSQKLHKSQASLKQIKDIIKHSSFTLSIENLKESYLSFVGSFKNEKNEERNINYEGIIELRGRAMLTKKLGNEKSKEEKETFELNKKFAERINQIEKINDLLKKIAEKGYSENIKITVDIEDTKAIFYTDNTKFKDYEDCSNYLNNILIKTTETQIDYYKNEETHLIRYIYGRQFNLFNNYLKNLSNISMAPFLKFMTNDKIPQTVNLEKIQYDYNYDLNKDSYICLLENINKFLSEFIKENLKNNIAKIYEQNIIIDKYKEEFKGLYTYLLEDDKIGEVQKGVEEHILNWCHFLTGNPPMAHTILLCNEETTSEEITAFMYRAFLCQYQAVFMVGKIELLNPDKRQTLTGLINTLFSGHENEMKSCLIFAYSDKTATIVQYLERIKGRKKLEHKDKKKGEQILYEQGVEIISSDKSGVGKSTQIRENIKKSKKKYIHFPFGGEFSRKDVINRLKIIEKDLKEKGDKAIHLDLYDSKQTELMKDFLYSFLITKLYGQNETLFYLSKDIEIKIEIPNGFVNFFLKFPILSMFKNRIVMTIDKLPKLIVPPQLDSNIQIVCNYLKILKEGKLANKDLYIKSVSMEPDDIKSLLNPDFIKEDTRIDATSLSQEECEKLIKENIGIELPTYYQINSFINALSGQLKKFSINFPLSAGNLIQNGNMLKKPDLKENRVKMINSFIQNTQHFSQGAFSKLLNSQLDTCKVGAENGNYDEKKQDDVAIKALSQNQEIISFDKIKPSLIFFHEGQGQEFSIISTCNHNEDEYKNLLELRVTPVIIQNEIYRANRINRKEKIPKELNDYSKFTQKQFYKELQQILDIKNAVDNSEKEAHNKNLKTIEEIVGEYVFTADNFIKMILILLRIRENIPVIMMGETGCGKTSLIRKLSELMNNGESKMKILNIHAGITDKEIYDFLYESKKDAEGNIIKSIVEEALILEKSEEEIKMQYKNKKQIYFEKKIWIFLDEINTCNCMGLICEMMTKNSCQGRPLPKSIVFIGACNPYRMVVKDEEPNGLKVPGTQERKLVYTVNPLPHSLLNFVFNFGNLTKKDEESYIKNMVVKPIESFYWREIKKDKKEPQPNEQQPQNQNEEEDKKNVKTLENYLSKEEFDQCQKLKNIASKSITEAQEYVRDKNDVSSVSLREIRRFSIFYNFFVEYLRKKKELFSNINQKEIFEQIDRTYKNMTQDDIYKYSINLSVFVCYYLRLTKKEFRDELSVKMNKHFGFDFKKMPKKEQEYISNNIEMKEGIAKNRALLENIFTLFVCINAKVPLFIVGKPGCSKSLSVQLLFKSMKGEISDNILFKTLPKIILNSYQGSLGSTSKGVLNIFKKARGFLEKETEENLSKIISMIYFDEMGLAEHSPNNPLKVIHSELEYDLNEGKKKIAFVGISNWRLDASKMNRGLYLSIPPPDLEDLKQTAQTIAESYSQQLANENKELFETLAITYHDYKNVLTKKYTKKEEFHGTRDFYHLIKNAMRKLLQIAEKEQNMDIDEHVKESIGIESLERNFGGLEFEDGLSSLEIVKQILQKKYVN